MQAAIYSHQYLIGHTDLQPGDVAMGGVYGEFIPTANYFSQVQQTIRELATDASPNHIEWSALTLNVQLENGYFLFPIGGYEIIDSPDFPHEPARIYLTGIAAEIINDFISIDPPRTFVEEPWEALTIRQKLALEAELERELASTPQQTAALASTSRASSKSSFSALCRFGPSDDVLFSTHNPAEPSSQYALIHLTWSGTHEKSSAFPRTLFFNSFAEFKLERMYPDRTEWES